MLPGVLRPTDRNMASLRFVRTVWDAFRASSGLEPRLLDTLQVTAARPGRVDLSLQIERHHTNRLGSVHGGTISSLVDLGGSLAVASKGLFATGVSTDLNVTFLASAGKVGDTLRCEVECDKFGKTMAFTRAVFLNEKGETVARGSHSKFVKTAWDDERNRVQEMVD